jgi:hypothetical protein
MITQGPYAGYKAEIDSYPVGAGAWQVCLALTDDVHGRADEYHRQTHMSAWEAQQHVTRLEESIRVCSSEPLTTPIHP